jgi:hypothetical protein
MESSWIRLLSVLGSFFSLGAKSASKRLLEITIGQACYLEQGAWM